MEGVGIEKNAFACNILRQWPFIRGEALRSIGFLEMVEIVDAASTEDVVWIAFQEVELLLELVGVAPEVVSFAESNIFALGPFEVGELDAAMPRHGMNVCFAEDRLYDVRIFCGVFLYNFRRCVWRRVIVDQNFEGKCRLLGQESFQAISDILFMFIGRAVDADKWR
jgi:hypothetical protein